MGRRDKNIIRRSSARPEVRTALKRVGFWAGMKGFFSSFVFVLFMVVVLALSIRGLAGNPTTKDLNTLAWKDQGPLELSPERGRFILLYSIVENHSFQFAVDLARVAAPDVSYIHGHYVSVFAPAVSFIVVPGYLIGKYFHISQVGSFAVIALFAVLNALLIRAISIRLGAHPIAGFLAAIAFVFGSPAFAYAVTLYQHHISTFLILLSIYLLIRFNSLFSLIIIWLLCAFSFTVDYPNAFMMLPIGIVGVLRMFSFEKIRGKRFLHLSLLRAISIVSVVLPMLFLFWFNALSYGNPFLLSGAVERAIEIKPNGSPLLELDVYKAQLKAAKQNLVIPQGSLLSLFRNRDIFNGFYIHFLSPDRGMIMYTPVMLLGIVGLVLALQKKQPYVGLLVGIIGFNVLLYSMWGDPYGGWAFGSRYLIPTYAILSLFLAQLLTYWQKKNLPLLIFLAILSYSVCVNTLGAITSSSNPPKIEADAIAASTHTDVAYTYLRNMQLLDKNISKSFVFQSVAQNYISAWNYYIALTIFIIVVSAFLVVIFRSYDKGGSYVSV